MLGLGLGVDKSRGGFGKFQYLSGLPSFVPSEYSLAFDASGAETLADYEAGTLYFRDSNFDRVGATFSRTTTATRVNKQGLIETVATNVPRIDYTDGSAKLLMEPSRTNVQSESILTGAGWTTQGSTTIQTGYASPDGNNDAIQIPNLTFANRIYRFCGVSSGTRNEPSIFIKLLQAETATILLVNPGNASYGNWEIDTSLIQPNTWTRITRNHPSVTITTEFVGDTVGRSGHYIFLSNTSDALNDAIQLYGAQIEVGSYPTSYIPTAGSTVTRNEDSCTLNDISWFEESSGTWYSESFSYDPNSSFREIFEIGTKTNRHLMRLPARYFIEDNNVVYVDIDGSTLLPNVYAKLAAKYNNSVASLYKDTILVGSDNSLTLPSKSDMTEITLFDDIQGGIKSFIYIPTALTDSECQQLTS